MTADTNDDHFHQVCSIEMVLGSSDAKKVILVADKILMLQQTDMKLFVITECQLIEMNDPDEGVKMVIKFKRKIMSEMMTTYLPSMLLMMITYATTFFKPLLIEAALSVNLTTMLVMTTIFMSKMEGLPPTSDIKMIDFWLILCQLVPFAQVVLVTTMEYIRDDEPSEKYVKRTGEDPSITRVEEIGPGQDGKDESKPREACVPMNEERDQTDLIQQLLTIGWFITSIKVNKINKNDQCSFYCREEGDAFGSTWSIRHLLFHCNCLLY